MNNFFIHPGQAQSIAEGIHEDAIFNGTNAKIACLKDEGNTFNIEKVEVAIVICSTTGSFCFVDLIIRLSNNTLQYCSYS